MKKGNPAQIGEDMTTLLAEFRYTDEQIAALVDGVVFSVEG